MTPIRPSGRPRSRPPRRPPQPPREGVTVTRLGTPPRPETDPAVQGALALDLGLHDAPPPAPELRVLSGADREVMEDGPAQRPPERTPGPRPHQEPDDVRGWAAQFAQAVVEVLGADRPLPQLLRWTSPEVYTDLGLRVRTLGRRAPAEQRRRLPRPQVRSVRVCRPSATVAEVSVHVRHGTRSRAVAARLERRRGRWQCTVLQFG